MGSSASLRRRTGTSRLTLIGLMSQPRPVACPPRPHQLQFQPPPCQLLTNGTPHPPTGPPKACTCTGDGPARPAVGRSQLPVAVKTSSDKKAFAFPNITNVC